MVPCTEKGPRRPTGLMKVAWHCETPAGHSGGMEGRLGEVLALRGRMSMSGKAGINSGERRGPVLTAQRPLSRPVIDRWALSIRVS